MSKVFNQVYKIVQSIPKGKVLTYVLISNLIEAKLSAQGVGWALNALSDKTRTAKGKKSANFQKSLKQNVYNSSNVPWHRVVNSKGYTSIQKRPDVDPHLQQYLLENEGIIFERDGRIDLDVYLWKTAEFSLNI